jgi:hypothetical protein
MLEFIQTIKFLSQAWVSSRGAPNDTEAFLNLLGDILVLVLQQTERIRCIIPLPLILTSIQPRRKLLSKILRMLVL